MVQVLYRQQDHGDAPLGNGSDGSTHGNAGADAGFGQYGCGGGAGGGGGGALGLHRADLILVQISVHAAMQVP